MRFCNLRIENTTNMTIYTGLLPVENTTIYTDLLPWPPRFADMKSVAAVICSSHRGLFPQISRAEVRLYG